MTRAIELAILGEGSTSPNPMVGAVLVHKDRILGEGYHARAGMPHAEVEAINSVKEQDKGLISESTLYVTLEPCCFQGRTPACTSLILQYRIPRVVIGTLDLTDKVSGNGVRLLQEHGIQVDQDICSHEAQYLAGIRNVSVKHDRPYVILKYAKSRDGFIGKPDGQVKLSNPLALRFVHRLRHRFDAIMVGTNTAIIDNPQLTNRFYGKKQPVRVLIDRHHRVPSEALIFSDPTKPIHLFCGTSEIKPNYPEHVSLHPLGPDTSFIMQLLAILKQEGITSLLVEGGAATIQHFIDENLWDEAYVSLSQLDLHHGIEAPLIPLESFDSYGITNDRYFWYLNYNGIKRE